MSNTLYPSDSCCAGVSSASMPFKSHVHTAKGPDGSFVPISKPCWDLPAHAACRSYCTCKAASFKEFLCLQVPVRIHVVESIPRSAAQKIQRWKLAEQLGQPPKDKPQSRPNSLNVLEEVEQAWEQELGARPAQPTDNFFGSGGGSMQAAALASNLSHRLSLAVDSALVISHPQPRALTTALEAKIQEAHDLVRLQQIADCT